MRLINTTTLELVEFLGTGNIPKFAILSHSWGDGEVSYQDYMQPDKFRETKKGYAKIWYTCVEARKNGIGYAWVDTCCIDKTSSAELTEAINSMFHWYFASEICYVFLADLNPEHTIETNGVISHEFVSCRWFTRGWTLQELIAPKQVEFFDSAWELRGTKQSLSQVLSVITRIDTDILRDSSLLSSIPVARRMSWVATRTTTRLEDMAYCMLGIFNINMALLYGEGDKAFIRLQEEIAKRNCDLSLFAWRTAADDLSDSTQVHHGIMASSPAQFANSHTIFDQGNTIFNPRWSISNKGLNLVAELDFGPSKTYAMKLNCYLKEDPTSEIGIYLRYHGGGIYSRVMPRRFIPKTYWACKKKMKVCTLLSVDQMTSRDVLGRDHQNGFLFRTGFDDGPFQPMVLAILPQESWDIQRNLFITHNLQSVSGTIQFTAKPNDPRTDAHEMFIIYFGFRHRSKIPWAIIISPLSDHHLYAQLAGASMDQDKLISIAESIQQWSVQLNCSSRDKPRLGINMSLNEVVIDGAPVFAIDLTYVGVQQSQHRGPWPSR